MPPTSAILAAGLLAAAAPAASAAVWSAPVQVSGNGVRFPASPPDLAVAPDGTAALAWQRAPARGSRNLAEVAQRLSATGPFEEPAVADFGSQGFAGPVVAAWGGGRALALWARRDPAGDAPAALGYGPTGLPSAPTAFTAPGRVTALHVGRHVLLWRTGAGAAGPLVRSSRAPGGAFGAAAELAPDATASAFAEAPDGATVTAWVAGGTLRALPGSGPAVDLGPAAGTPSVAVARGGRALVVWCGGGAVHAAERIGGDWTAPRRLGGGTPGRACALPPAAAVAADGSAVAAWRSLAGGRLDVHAARRRAAGEWTGARRLGRAPRNVGAPITVLGPRGSALVAWVQPTGTSGSVIATRSAAPGAAWGPRADIAVRRYRATAPDVGADAAGRVTLAWLAVPNGPYALGLRVMTARRLAPLR